MLHRNLLLLILVAVLGWAGSTPAPAQIPTSFFEGWVSYQLIDSKAKMSTSKMWDTLFIAGDRAARKSSSISTVHYQSGYHDFLKTVERTRFTVYERRVRRFTFAHAEQLGKAPGRQSANEIIFTDSIERVREARRMVDIVPMDSTKIILGFPCRLALVKTRDTYYTPPREYAVLVFYTDQLPNLTDEYGKLGGLPLECWAFGGLSGHDLNNAVHSVATSIVATLFPSACFEPRRIYPHIEVRSKVWDGKVIPLQQHPNAAKRTAPRPFKQPAQLRERTKPGKYAWEAH